MDGTRKFSTVSNITDIETGLDTEEKNNEDGVYIIGRPQRDVIIEDNFESVLDIRRHEKYQKKKWVYFSCCAMCNFAGIMLILYALAVTNEFTGKDDQPNYIALGFGCAAFLPFIAWLRVIFCPGEKTRSNY